LVTGVRLFIRKGTVRAHDASAQVVSLKTYARTVFLEIPDPREQTWHVSESGEPAPTSK
jgi:hypothetical protein